MTERNDRTVANSAPSEDGWTPCLITGEVCGETPASHALNEGIENKEDPNVSH